MLKLLSVMNAFVVLARVNGSRGLREAEVVSMTIHKPGDRQQAVHLDYVPERDKINQRCYV